jgi:N-acetylglucosaminyldiphosphoundecaprenol N-acetyl-beta-D-mannosaminyltransferase
MFGMTSGVLGMTRGLCYYLAMKRVHVAGIPVDTVRLIEALIEAGKYLEGDEQCVIATPNPEMAVLASRDEEFARILESADLCLPDGYGLKLFAPLFGERIPEIVTGTDFVLGLTVLCHKTNGRMYFLGGGEGVAERCAEVLKTLGGGIEIAGAQSGGVIEYRKDGWHQDEKLVEWIAATRPDVLLVALGHGKQERWIRDHLKRLPSVRIAIGVGGAFDYYAGVKKRPPGWMRALHLEWLWRLLREPKRIGRILTAVVVFPLLALKIRLKGVK